MRPCPVCYAVSRSEIFDTTYQVPDGWTVPSRIVWFACDNCGMLYGDGNFTQADLDAYYRDHYGYGVNNPDNVKRLQIDATVIANAVNHKKSAIIADFGGAGDDGRSVLVEALHWLGYTNAVCVNVGEPLPAECDVIYASHVLEHIYDLPQTMDILLESLVRDGLLYVDVPDSTGLLLQWGMPMLDFNTKHVNHFTIRNLLDLGWRYGLEAVNVKPYLLENAPCVQVCFKRMSTARGSAEHVRVNVAKKIDLLQEIREPVNIWGLGDITWHVLSLADVDVLEFIDNDPAFRGQTFCGKPIKERPSNDAPIVILSQGQRRRLIENIRKAGVQNSIVEL